jgi:16S rRNA processing protein RimM
VTEHKAPRPSPKTSQVRVGRLTKAHGLKGALKIELYTDDPDKRFRPGAVFDLQVPTSSPWHGKTLELIEMRFYNGTPVGFFHGVADRTAAEGLVKAILWVDQDPAELPEEKDAWYDYQLVGLRALRDGVEVGRVARVEHFPAQDLLAITVGEREVLVPFVAAIVPAVDIAAGTVTLTPPPGLFEDLADDDPEPASGSAAATENAAESSHRPE